MREELLFLLYRAGNWGTPRLLPQEHTTRKWQSLFPRSRASFLSLQQNALSSSLHPAPLADTVRVLPSLAQTPEPTGSTMVSQLPKHVLSLPLTQLFSYAYFVRYVFVYICHLSLNSCGDQKKGELLKLPYISPPPQHAQPHNIMGSTFTQQMLEKFIHLVYTNLNAYNMTGTLQSNGES